MDPQKNLAAHFPSSTAHGARVARDGHAWPCVSGAARHWLLPALAPVYGIGSPRQLARRRALPPLDIKCSTVWHSLPPDWQKRRGAGCWRHLFPLRRLAGAPWISPTEQRGSFKYANGLCRRLFFACQPVPDVCAWRVTWMVFTFALVDLFGYEHAVKCLWKSWSSSFAWNACACACSSRCARASCEIDPVVNGGAGVHSCPW
jgi:hypothetical protein